MRLRDLLEAPISDITAMHMDRDGSFRPEDQKKITSTEWRERVIRLFRNSPYDFKLFIVNGDENNKVLMKGKTWIDRLDVSVNNVKNYVGLHSLQWAESIVGHPLDGHGITVLMFNNEGSERVGLTPWIVAHRIAHMFLESNQRAENDQINRLSDSLGQALSSLLYYLESQEPFNKTLRYGDADYADIFKALSPFRTARTGNVRDRGEYGVELMTQFLISGKVTFLHDWIKGERVQPHEFSPIEQEIIKVAQTITHDVDTMILRASRPNRGKDLDLLYTALRGNPIRPRSKEQLRLILDRIVSDDRMVKPFPTSNSERQHDRLDNYESKINEIFGNMLKLAVGKVIAL